MIWIQYWSIGVVVGPKFLPVITTEVPPLRDESTVGEIDCSSGPVERMCKKEE